MNKPSDDYDVKAWEGFYAANPHLRRSVGAEGADDPPADGPPNDTPPEDPPADPPADPPKDKDEPPSDPPDWRAGIQDEKLRDVAGNFKSLDALVKNTMDLRGKLSTAINEPGEDATEDEIAAYRVKRGVPESPDKYTVPEIEGYERSEADTAYQERMANVFHKRNIPDDVFQELAGEHVAFLQEQAKAAKEAQDRADKEYLAEAEAENRKAWGKDFNANLQYADEAGKTFWEEDIGGLELKNGMLLGSHPVFMRGMAEIGRRLGEGVIHVPEGSEAANSLHEQADSFREKRMEAQRKGDHKAAVKWDAEERKVLDKIYGTKAAG